MSKDKLYTDAYISIYQDLVGGGIAPDVAQKIAHDKVGRCREIVEGVVEELEEDGWYCLVRKSIPVKLLEGWWVKSEKEKEEILYSLGFDIRMPWREKEGYFRIKNVLEEGRYVEGSERTDMDWQQTGHMSWEAGLEVVEAVHGKHHRNELDRKMRGM